MKKLNKRILFLSIPIVAFLGISAVQQSSAKYSLRIARLKYNGGGDWYGSRTALANMAKFCNASIKTSIDPQEATVEPMSSDIFNYPYVFMTGHGNVVFNEAEAANLRTYLQSGGFLHICDNYGMDKYVRPQMKKVFPELEFVELPFSHPIYHAAYQFNNGLVKVHEHDGKPAQGFGLVLKGRLVCFYDYQCDLGNGWEDAEVYNDPAPIRQKALEMGANIIQYSFTN